MSEKSFRIKNQLINYVEQYNYDGSGSGEAIEVDPIVIEILKKGVNSSKLSNGKFNIFACIYIFSSYIFDDSYFWIW